MFHRETFDHPERSATFPETDAVSASRDTVSQLQDRPLNPLPLERALEMPPDPGESGAMDKPLPIIPAGDPLVPGSFLIPMLDQAVSAGPGVALDETDTVTGYIPVPKALRRYGTSLTALPVKGDSMEPTIGHDDMVVCDTCGWEGDGIYALHMDDGAYVKRLAKRPRGIRVISDNKAYESYDVEPERDGVKVIGRVRCILKVVR